MDVLRGKRSRTPPIWLMRQAGRYLPEYRRIRQKISFKALCRSPRLASDAAVSAARALDVDAAILFSDILLILEAMGSSVTYRKAGPVFKRVLRRPADIRRLHDLKNNSLSFVYEAVRTTRRNLSPRIPLIGFSGAPFTLASYLVEGESSRNFIMTRKFMLNHPGAWRSLMNKLVKNLGIYLSRQVSAGADCVQIFDSWVGCLSPDQFREFVLPYSKRLIAKMKRKTRVIYFGTGTAPFLKDFLAAGADACGVDWRVDLKKAFREHPKTVFMGNLDPTLLFANFSKIKKEAGHILRLAKNRPFIFNLGHGVLPGTPPENVKKLVRMVKNWAG